MDYYDKNGSPITMEQWERSFDDPRFKRVGFDSNDKYEVSTVWLGLNHSWGGEIQIFETMVFECMPDKNSRDDIDMARYATLEEAQQGHIAFVQKWLGEDYKPKSKEYKLNKRFSDL